MKKSSLLLISASLLSITMANCSSSTSTKSPKSGVNQANLDTCVAPGEDFYAYACGGWQKNNPLPAEFARFGSFDKLGEDNRQQLMDLISGLDASTAEKGSNTQKIADLYAMGMDSVKLNQLGASPIVNDIALLQKATKADIPTLVASMPGVSAFFGNYVSGDAKNADINAMYLGESGLGMGDRDYYINDTDDEKRVREAYKTYLSTLAKLAGYSDADASRLVENTLAVETTLAKASMTREEQRDVLAQYNPIAVAEFVKTNPNVNLVEYFKAQGLENVDTVIVDHPSFFATVNEVIENTPVEALQDYLVSGYLTSAAPYLSDDFVDAEFQYSKAISGVEQQQPRWKRAMSVPNHILGEALGQLYVEKYFPQSSKDKMLALVGNLQEALGQHIDSLAWMSDATKTRAHEKLASFTVKIGYPDKWRDYSALDIDPEKPYWENIKNAIVFNNQYNLSDYGKPVDRDRWFMTPQTVNAYYNPSTNEICFPAGILQKPFFDPEADDAANYGAIGVVIGHEMTHGYDDQGRQFDKDGNMADWWTPEDAAAFEALAAQLADQFDQIVVLGDVHANGKFTLGENIADQGGLRVAHTAYHNSLKGQEGNEIDGLTPDQRFYLAYANVWAANIRDEEILRRTKSDPHSLGRWRVNASLRNLDDFFNAFGIVEGDSMYRPVSERVIIW